MNLKLSAVPSPLFHDSELFLHLAHSVSIRGRKRSLLVETEMTVIPRKGVLASDKADRLGSSAMLAKLANTDFMNDCQKERKTCSCFQLFNNVHDGMRRNC